VPRAVGAALAVLMVMAMLIGCVKQAVLPADCSATTVQRQATLAGDRLAPEAITVCKGQELTLKITTERAGEIHLHGYEKEMEVQPGDTATFTFSTTLPGQFPIELHTPNNGPEIEIGILTVNEP
jgi:hypothetical protein